LVIVDDPPCDSESLWEWPALSSPCCAKLGEQIGRMLKRATVLRLRIVVFIRSPFLEKFLAAGL
jgi:hypothetical protein